MSNRLLPKSPQYFQPLKVDLAGIKDVDSRGSSVVLKSARLEDSNSIDEPTNVVPVTESIDGLGATFTWRFAPYSITVLKVNGK
jgi:alpha-L-arabinofuranosidase